MIYFTVIDSFGIGSSPDAYMYGDEGANTARSASMAYEGSKWSFLEKLGIANSANLVGTTLEGVSVVKEPLACYGALAKKGKGKDTQTGHWELAGMETEIELRTVQCFSDDILDELSLATGRHFIGNYTASGTEIIKELGQKSIDTMSPIIYTSADSVMQIAAHTGYISLDELYDICHKARTICDRSSIGRVIARPFTGNADTGFTRTKDRRDFGIALPAKTYLDKLIPDMGLKTIGIGKIGDIFNESGLALSYHDKGNEACLDRLFDVASNERNRESFVFTNLVDTDMLYGHRRDSKGYCNEIEHISARLDEFCSRFINGRDMLVISADHGCDPAFKGTDHTREYVPLLIYSSTIKGIDLGVKQFFGNAMLLALDIYMNNQQ